MNISNIDRNFQVQTSLKIDNIKFYNPQEVPFTIYGLFHENGLYRRLPEQVAKSVSENVFYLHSQTAGGRIKFITDSSYVAIHAKMPYIGKMPHFALAGSAGFDLYLGKKEEYYGTFTPPFDISDGYESVLYFGGRAEREITINFPLYSRVSELYIGLEADTVVKKSAGYKYEKPIVYYGSSITQGGCASRPGNAYQGIVSRALQTNYINLGFSGSAKAEDEIAQYIKTLNMSIFVYDYDHNANTLEDLEKTHQKMFQTIRQAQPQLPIVILSRPRFRLDNSEKKRREIIKRTYEAAVASGDQNVYFIDGSSLMKYGKNDTTVDGCHPNDMGFYSMAKVLTKHLKPILKQTP